jgi:hypothetical protein
MPEPVPREPRPDDGGSPFWLSPFPFREPDWPPPDETEDA